MRNHLVREGHFVGTKFALGHELARGLFQEFDRTVTRKEKITDQGSRAELS